MILIFLVFILSPLAKAQDKLVLQCTSKNVADAGYLLKVYQDPQKNYIGEVKTVTLSGESPVIFLGAVTIKVASRWFFANTCRLDITENPLNTSGKGPALNVHLETSATNKIQNLNNALPIDSFSNLQCNYDPEALTELCK